MRIVCSTVQAALGFAVAMVIGETAQPTNRRTGRAYELANHKTGGRTYLNTGAKKTPLLGFFSFHISILFLFS